MRLTVLVVSHPSISHTGTFDASTMSTTRRDLFDNIAPVYDQVTLRRSSTTTCLHLRSVALFARLLLSAGAGVDS